MNAYAALKITDAHPCSYCGAITGEPCSTSTGIRAQSPHVLRVNMAKRAAVRGTGGSPVPCPAKCGDDLYLEKAVGWVRHIRTGVFECEGS